MLPILAKTIHQKSYEKLCLFFVGLGVLSRIALYIQNPDLSLDDCMLAASMWTIPWSDIFAGHLPYNQSAPLGFLLLVRGFCSIFGDSEFVLRFLPLLAGICLLPLAYYFMQKEFGIRAACIFLFLLVCSDVLLCYSVQFKQYSLEAFLSLAFLTLYSHFKKEITEESNVPWKLILVAVVGTQFGNTGFFVLFGILVAIFVQGNAMALLKNNWYKFLVFVVYSVLYYVLWLSQIDAVKNGYMEKFWESSYLPINAEGIKHWLKPMGLPWDTLEIGIGNIADILSSYFFSFFIDFTPVLLLNSLMFLILFFVGLSFLRTRERRLFFTLVSVFLLAIIMYIFRYYPLFCLVHGRIGYLNFAITRISLYLFPLALIPVAICAEKLFSIRNKFFLVIIFAVIVIFAVFQNIQRIYKGIHVYEISDFINKIEDIPKENKMIITFALDEPSYLYNKHRMANDLGDIYLIQDEAIDIKSMPQTKLQRHIIVDALNLREKEWVIFIMDEPLYKLHISLFNDLVNKNECIIFEGKHSYMLILHNSLEN